ncbi:MAG: two-component system, sensor histidine kinase and response regulator, partial [Solirubrobacteraceae bacterium]|nr:two-component system, sensor histidine kinase and response regulator [Solirubrobacteraceae bacterium]
MTIASTPAVLVVDDNAGKRLALKAVLLPLGYTVVEADSGIAALRCLLRQDFAVILLDVSMPGIDGFETAALIRQRQQSERTPIIFITAKASDDLRLADRYAQGAVDFIFAPVAPAELRAKVTVFADLFNESRNLATRAEEAQMSADQLRLLTQAAPIGMFQTDARNRYVYTNPHWTEITGVTAEDAAGQPRDAVLGTERDDGPSEGGQRFDLRPPDHGEDLVVHVVSSPIHGDDGMLTGSVGTLADITAEVSAAATMAAARDEATAASRMKSDFLANMSHEIRTPMNGVLGMTDLLLETALDDRQRDYAQTVRNSGEALLTIINDILDFSKVEVGKLEIEAIEFELRTVVEDVATLLAVPAQAKNLELVVAISKTVPARVHGDPGRVRQVLTNIIGNAIKFTPAGEIVVRVSAIDETVVRFEVADTGDGIEPEKLEVIFQPFTQADTSTTRQYGGTGLGLAISSQLVTLMGGDCGVTSELGTGSVFWFTIAVKPCERPAHPSSPAIGDGLTGIRTLIVDGSAAQREVLSEYLTDWGAHASTSASCEAAMVTLREGASAGQGFDLVLAARSMPGMDGGQLAAAVAADATLTARVVLMTAQNDIHGPSAAGVRASLAKPVRRTELRACLRRAMQLEPATAAYAEFSGQARAKEIRGRVLLAEDNAINRKVAMAMLAGGGYEVDAVVDGVAAVEAAAAHAYDAILMDCQMPELNGYEATSAIRAQEHGLRHTPIIAMTAGARLA